VMDELKAQKTDVELEEELVHCLVFVWVTLTEVTMDERKVIKMDVE